MKWIVVAALLALASWPAVQKGHPLRRILHLGDEGLPDQPVVDNNRPGEEVDAGRQQPGNAQQSAEYGDLVPATITCPKGRVLLPGNQPPMGARLKTGAP